MNKQDEIEFCAYLTNCTDRQLQGVYEKELKAEREDYIDLVALEATSRGVILEWDIFN